MKSLISRLSASEGLFGYVRRALGLKEIVGADDAGTKFIRYTDKNDYGETVERRECIPRDPNNWDINQVDPAWRQWMSGTRRFPPTPEEIEQNRNRIAMVRARAAIIQKEDERRRLRNQNASGEEGPSMDHFLRQLRQAGEAPPGDVYAEPPKSGSGSGDTFEAEPWKPGK